MLIQLLLTRVLIESPSRSRPSASLIRVPLIRVPAVGARQVKEFRRLRSLDSDGPADRGTDGRSWSWVQGGDVCAVRQSIPGRRNGGAFGVLRDGFSVAADLHAVYQQVRTRANAHARRVAESLLARRRTRKDRSCYRLVRLRAVRAEGQQGAGGGRSRSRRESACASLGRANCAREGGAVDRPR